MEKKFEFRYRTIRGTAIEPAIPAAEKDAFEQKCNAKATACFDRYNQNPYVLALLSDDGTVLLRGLIIADAA